MPVIRSILILSSTLAVVVLCCGLCGAARSQSFPTRPVTLIVPYSVGGATDVQLRVLAAATEKFLGHRIVIENRPSATGMLGPAQVATTNPDGYTVTQINTGVLRLPFMTKTSYDPVTDFTYIIGISGLTSGLVVRKDAPWKTFGDLMADAKAHPGKITFGSPGGAANPYVVMQLIAKREGISWVSVPFKGFSESSNALLGGHIDAVSDAAGWAPLVNAGELRLLVTYGSARSRNWPDVPTLGELGIDVVSNAAYGIAGPKGIDPAVVKTLHDGFKSGMESATFVDILRKFEQEPIYRSTADYRDYVMQEIAEQKRIVDELGLKQP
jgi:tripartite-type tricarboxylate transporter receptor subunit TctC